MSQTWVCHSAESGRFCARGDRPDRAPAGCSYGYLSGRVPRMSLGCPPWVREATKSLIASDLPRFGRSCDPFLPTPLRGAESDPAFDRIEVELAKQPVNHGPYDCLAWRQRWRPATSVIG